jgi:hypothetical protein
MIRHAVLACLVACAVVAVGFVGCVDIPTSGPAVPDYRSQVRVMHQAYTVDTLALLQGTQSTTKPSDTTLTPNGPDVVRLIRDTVITFKQYKRIRFDFASPMDVIIDGQVFATVANGQATGYVDIASGARKLSLRGTATWVDSLSVEDTVAVVTLDTIKADGRTTQKEVTATPLRNDNFFPLAQTPVATIVDSLVGLQSTGTETKSTLLLAYETDAAISHVPPADTRNGAVRYGRIRYRWSTERSSFTPAAVADSIQVRYANTAKSLTYSVDGGTPGRDVDVANLRYSNLSGYYTYRATGVPSYSFRFTRNLTTTVVDSAIVAPAGKSRITVVLTDSLDANNTVIKQVTRVYVDD